VNSKKRTLPRSLEKLHPIGALGNAPAGEGDIRIERLERRLDPRVPFPHKHDYFQFVTIEKGSGWHEIDFSRYSLRSPQIFFVRPSAVHSWSFNASTHGFVLEFTESSLGNRKARTPLVEELASLPSALAGESAASLFPLLGIMRAEFCAAAPGFRASLEHLLHSFLIQIARGASVTGPLATKPQSLAMRFRFLVEKNFESEHSVEFYANQLGVSAKALTMRLARSIGKSAGAVIQERCLVEAKRLLAYSTLPVSEIAYRLGYEDPNYFARFFRQKTGLAPGKFRELASRSVPH
jgi:AraC-like DNA-binding protein